MSDYKGIALRVFSISLNHGRFINRRVRLERSLDDTVLIKFNVKISH